MSPQQEYYLRNGIRSPFVFYGNGRLLLKNLYRVRSPDKYRCVDIRLLNKEGNDGFNIGRFELGVYAPCRHDPYGSESKFTGAFEKVDDYSCYWSEYFDFILGRVDCWRVGNLVPVTGPELHSACWEILSYSQDSNFSELPLEIVEMNFLALNAPAESKSDLIAAAMLTLEDRIDDSASRKIVSAWRSLYEAFVRVKYSHWLANLFHKENR